MKTIAKTDDLDATEEQLDDYSMNRESSAESVRRHEPSGSTMSAGPMQPLRSPPVAARGIETENPSQRGSMSYELTRCTDRGRSREKVVERMREDRPRFARMEGRVGRFGRMTESIKLVASCRFRPDCERLPP